MRVPSSARPAVSRSDGPVLPIARCRLESRRRGASPACALRGIARRQLTAEHDDPVKPVERVLEIAQTRVRLGAIEARPISS